MDRIRLLRNPIRSYAWGSRTALAALTGRRGASAEPEAELWMGAHPSGPSEVQDGDRWVALDAWIARDARAVLGEGVARAFGGELPFLFKVLAPERALSIQTHPDRAQAQRGFERENAAGLERDDPRRCYRDPNPKPELICALDGFEALCGFRPREEIVALLAALELEAFEPILELLRSSETQALRRAFHQLMSLPDADKRALARSAARAARGASADADPAHALVAELARDFPDDIGVLAPLWLNRVELGPGEALFLPAGELHAYLRGVGVELMANSDNVLRGGLTNKHVDVPELLGTLTFREGHPDVLEPRTASDGARRYATPAREFELSRIDVAPDRPYEVRVRHSVEIALCTRGHVRAIDLRRGEAVDAPQGRALLLPAALASYRLEGEGSVHRAGVAS